MIVAPDGCGDAEEDAVDEQKHRDFLHPKPRASDQARDDVRKDDNAEAGDRQSTEQHQHLFEPVERTPLEMALMLQHEAVETGHSEALDASDRSRVNRRRKGRSSVEFEPSS